MNTSKPGILIFLNLLLGFLGFALPFLSGTLMIPLLIVPLLLYCAAVQIAPLPLCAVFPGAVLLSSLINGQFELGIVLLALFVPPALITRYCTHRLLPLKRSVLYLATYFFILIAIGICVGTVQSYGQLSFSSVSQYLSKAMDGMLENYRSIYLSGVSQEDAAQLLPALDEMLTGAAALFDRCFLGLFLFFSIIGAFLCTAIARLVVSFSSGDRTLRNFVNYKVSKPGAVLFAVAVLLSFFSGTVGTFGLNLAYALTPALMLQGVGFIGYLIARRGRNGGGIGFYYLIILVVLLLFPTDVVAVIAGAFGVADTFTNIRLTAE